MIEVIYDRDETSEENNDDTNAEFKMPKNIRQIGAPNPRKRIYIEDYVVTYLKYISRPGSTHARGAILLGEVVNNDNGINIFVSGAVEAENIEFEIDEDTFSEKSWKGIYEDIKDNFPELSIVGWYLSRLGYTTDINDRIKKTHFDQFPGEDKVLYIYDALDDEMAFYMSKGKELLKCSGFYIYYAKNEPMQEYIISERKDECPEKQDRISVKDGELIKSFRKKNNKYTAEKQKEDEKNSGFGFVAVSFAVVMLLLIGITVVNNYDKVKSLQTSVNRLDLTSGDDVRDTVVPVNGEVAEATEDYDNLPTAESTVSAHMIETEETEEETTELTEEIAEEITEEPDIISDSTAETINEELPNYYTIKAGDTLTSISIANYNSAKYVKLLAEANEIALDDKIYVGQIIIIPVLKEK